MQCPCKINLGLTVGPRLAHLNGLHQIYSLFLPIRIGPFSTGDSVPAEMESMAFHGDTIDIRTASNFEFHSRNLISGPYEISRAFEAVSERGSDLNKNLMVQAAEMLAPHSGHGAQPISIRIDKRIPPGTGVGAGSANAAQILLFAVKQNWITIDQARDMAPALGSDVSFFLDQKPALVEGTGERIHHVESGPLYGVLCFPGLFVSTAEAYSRLKRPLQQSEDAKLGSLLSDSDWQAVAAGAWGRLAHWTNDFEEPVLSMHPLLGEIKESMVRVGADYCSLSGSGSALYGLYSSGQRAQAALDSLKSQYPELPFETFALWD